MAEAVPSPAAALAGLAPAAPETNHWESAKGWLTGKTAKAVTAILLAAAVSVPDWAGRTDSGKATGKDELAKAVAAWNAADEDDKADLFAKLPQDVQDAITSAESAAATAADDEAAVKAWAAQTDAAKKKALFEALPAAIQAALTAAATDGEAAGRTALTTEQAELAKAENERKVKEVATGKARQLEIVIHTNSTDVRGRVSVSPECATALQTGNDALLNLIKTNISGITPANGTDTYVVNADGSIRTVSSSAAATADAEQAKVREILTALRIADEANRTAALEGINSDLDDVVNALIPADTVPQADANTAQETLAAQSAHLGAWAAHAGRLAKVPVGTQTRERVGGNFVNRAVVVSVLASITGTTYEQAQDAIRKELGLAAGVKPENAEQVAQGANAALLAAVVGDASVITQAQMDAAVTAAGANATPAQVLGRLATKVRETAKHK